MLVKDILSRYKFRKMLGIGQDIVLNEAPFSMVILARPNNLF